MKSWMSCLFFLVLVLSCSHQDVASDAQSTQQNLQNQQVLEPSQEAPAIQEAEQDDLGLAGRGAKPQAQKAAAKPKNSKIYSVTGPLCGHNMKNCGYGKSQKPAAFTPRCKA